MRQKKRKFFEIILVLGVLLIGCGKGKKEATTSTTTEAVPIQQEQATMTDVAVQPELPKDEEGYFITNDFVKTVGETINVRVSPSIDADIYVLLAAGEVLNRTGYNEEWTKVLMDGRSFYIYSDYVIQTEPPEGVIPEQSQTATGSDAVQLEKKIVIDPANQSVVNAEPVAIGPNTDVTKQGASTGNVGTTYGTKESELNLTYARLLQTELTARGYEVILTRETDEVNMTNKERAEFANASGATTFVRIQMNYSENDALSGAMAVCMPADSEFNGQLHGESYKLATRLLQGVLDATACENQGVYETDQMTSINWSQIPVTIIKLGYLSNANEESKLIDPEYQKSLVKGIADGIDYYYGNK